MDWYTWLSKSNLDTTLVYEYGTTFARNELQEDDLVYFNHEFLQSIGISVAKHRLEILKLTKNEVKIRPNGFSRLFLAMNRTKKLFMTKLSFRKNSGRVRGSDPDPYQEKEMIKGRTRSVFQSGPLDRKVQEKFMLTMTNRSVSVSGPLDGKMQERLTWSPMATRPSDERTERLGYFCKSPTISGAIDRWGLSPQVNYYKSEKVGEDEYGVESLWSMMFQDMKPT